MTPARTIWWRWIAAVAAVLLSMLGSGCAPQRPADERNVHYRRGIQLLRHGKHEAAEQAFQRSLRLNPDSAGTHLQLAMLYEDILDRPAAAIAHYDAYLRLGAGTDETARAVGRWIERVERHYLRELAERYPDDALRDRATSPPASNREATAVPEAADNRPADIAPLTERERNLAARVKALHGEIHELRQALAARATAATPPGATSVPPRGDGVPAAPALRSSERSHVVAVGDTLSQLSRKYYGTHRHWPRIREANADILAEGATLRPGMRLRIPLETADAAGEPERTAAQP